MADKYVTLTFTSLGSLLNVLIKVVNIFLLFVIGAHVK